MIGILFLFCCAALMPSASPAAQGAFEKDSIKTSAGNLAITFIGHGTLLLEYKGTRIHVDPYSRLADYQKLPKADLILITHHHADHLDRKAIEAIRRDNTVIVVTQKGAPEITGSTVMGNGDVKQLLGITVEAVPAYNLVHKRSDGSPFHPKGEGNGYVLTFGKTRLYIAGDTENTPEMKALKNIDVAFLPMNLPYTMTPEMVADAVRGFSPKVLYPYHYGETDLSQFTGLMKNITQTEVRIRKMQ